MNHWPCDLNVSDEALQLYCQSEVIDLHTDSFLWKRLIGYRMQRWHQLPWRARFGGQVDLPRCVAARMAGVVWDIVANPLIPKAQKYGQVRKYISQIREEIQAHPDFQLVSRFADYQRARAAGKIASWISIQGGQALDHNLHDLSRIPEVHRITLVHFTQSRIGASNFDRLNAHRGLKPFGRDFVARMVQEQILVDLSHINRRGFFDALAVMPTDVPPIVTHTGVQGVAPLWRNLDDAQIKAIAERHGTIGVIYEQNFLGPRRSVAGIVDHMAHIIRVAGEDFVSLGSDYDGMITPPRDLPDIRYQPRLVQEMLQRGWTSERIQKILGQNFLRVLQSVRP